MELQRLIAARRCGRAQSPEPQPPGDSDGEDAQGPAGPAASPTLARLATWETFGSSPAAGSSSAAASNPAPADSSGRRVADLRLSPASGGLGRWDAVMAGYVGHHLFLNNDFIGVLGVWDGARYQMEVDTDALDDEGPLEEDARTILER